MEIFKVKPNNLRIKTKSESIAVIKVNDILDFLEDKKDLGDNLLLDYLRDNLGQEYNG